MKITNKDAVTATDAVLKRMDEVHKLIDADHDMSVSLQSGTASRVFLTCFMVLSFNDDVPGVAARGRVAQGDVSPQFNET